MGLVGANLNYKRLFEEGICRKIKGVNKYFLKENQRFRRKVGLSGLSQTNLLSPLH